MRCPSRRVARRSARRALHSAAWLGALTIFVVACDATDAAQPEERLDAADVVSVEDAPADATEEVDAADAEPPRGLGDVAPDGPGALPVSHTSFTLAREERRLTVELWYPTVDRANVVETVPDAFLSGDEAQTYAELLAGEGGRCATQSVQIPRDAPVARSAMPLVLLSHCHTCTRFNWHSVASHLAAHGFVVAAPDHVGNTLFDALREEAEPFGPAFLEVRGADMLAVLDAILGGALEGLAGEVAAAVDPDLVAVAGHSFGGVTSGWVLERDARVRAGISVAAPMENPLLAGVDLAAISQPTLHVVAVEDNSILEIGNRFIRENFEDIATPSYLLEVTDAGHWSFSDLAGVVPSFDPGCGDGERQTDGSAFTYLPPSAAIPLLARVMTVFLRASLAQDADAEAWLAAPSSLDGATWQARP